MKPLYLAVLREAVAEERIQWRNTFSRSWPNAEFSNKPSAKCCSKARRFEITRKIAPLRARLFLGYIGGKPLHVVAACDEISREAFVITAYEPSLDVFKSDYRTRKKL